MYAKHYENPTMLSRVTAKNVGDVFLRHTVYSSWGAEKICSSIESKYERQWQLVCTHLNSLNVSHHIHVKDCKVPIDYLSVKGINPVSVSI